jgi:hypothetical protein
MDLQTRAHYRDVRRDATTADFHNLLIFLKIPFATKP